MKLSTNSTTSPLRPSGLRWDANQRRNVTGANAGSVRRRSIPAPHATSGLRARDRIAAFIARIAAGALAASRVQRGSHPRA